MTKKIAYGLIEQWTIVDIVTSGYGVYTFRNHEEWATVYRIPALGRKNQFFANNISMLSYLVLGGFVSFFLMITRRYDVIHTHFVMPTGPLGHLMSLIFRKKNILHIYGEDIVDESKKTSPYEMPIIGTMIRYLLDHADQVVSISSITTEKARKYARCERPISTIKIPYSPIAFSPLGRKELGLDPDKKYLISIGRFVERKGFSYLLDVLKALPEDIHLILIGSGILEESLKQYARELKIYDRVVWTHSIDEEKKMQYLNVADIYVLSSVSEGFGIVLQEAMQVGLPIVLTNVGWQNDFIKDNVNGLYMTYGDVSKACSNIEKLLSDTPLYERMRSNNLRDVASFSMRSVLDTYTF